MARTAESIVDLIGGTPLVRLNRVTKGLRPKVYAKLEFLNPGGSVKDRIGLAMILDAERKGLIKPGSTIVEPTSGNTGMGLALVSILRGYKMIFTVPDKMSKDKVDLLRAVGAKVFVTPSSVPPGHPSSYIEVAKKIAKNTRAAFMPNQYENRANVEAHYSTTGPEIWNQTHGRVDVLVAGIGTGGTISGTGRYLKERKPSLRVVGVDPDGSILASRFRRKRGKARPYKVEGIGEDFLPKTFDMGVVDEIFTVTDKDSMLMSRRLAREEGIVAGGSSGAAVFGAVEVARRSEHDDFIVVILPDTGRSYLNKVFNDDWMAEQGFLPSTGRSAEVRDLLASKPKSRPRLISCSPEENLGDASKIMSGHRISNLPVIDKGVLVGNVSASTVVKHYPGAGSRVMVGEVMEGPLPTVGFNVKMNLPGTLISMRGAAVVVDGTRPVGILTATDVIGYIAKEKS